MMKPCRHNNFFLDLLLILDAKVCLISKTVTLSVLAHILMLGWYLNEVVLDTNGSYKK